MRKGVDGAEEKRNNKRDLKKWIWTQPWQYQVDSEVNIIQRFTLFS